MGSSTDLESEGLRRLLVNASYWCVGLEKKIADKANVDIVGRIQAVAVQVWRLQEGRQARGHALTK